MTQQKRFPLSILMLLVVYAKILNHFYNAQYRSPSLLHSINLKGCVDCGFYNYGTLKSTFPIQTHSEIDTSTTSGHPLSVLFNEPLEFHWIRQWKLNFKVRPAQPCPTSPFCHIEICLHSAWQCEQQIIRETKFRDRKFPGEILHDGKFWDGIPIFQGIWKFLLKIPGFYFDQGRKFQDFLLNSILGHL